jgi:large subunit ribosomal protein L24
MVKSFIKVGDTVEVLSGDDKKKQGLVLKVYPKTGRGIVQGINIITKHEKKKQGEEKGKIVKKEAPIRLCKLIVLDPTNKVISRIGRRKNEKGKLQRYCIKTGNFI